MNKNYENFNVMLIKIIKAKKYKKITIPELSDKIRISATAVEKNIAKLKQRDLLKRIGPDKGGYWEISSQVRTAARS